VAQSAVVTSNASSCRPHFETEAVLLVTLTFQPLNGVRGHLSCGLPSCQFLASILDLVSGMRQTDGQTDNSHQRLMPPPVEAGEKLWHWQWLAGEWWILLQYSSDIFIASFVPRLQLFCLPMSVIFLHHVNLVFRYADTLTVNGNIVAQSQASLSKLLYLSTAVTGGGGVRNFCWP